MGEVINLGKEPPTSGTQAVADVVKWLREQADRLESGEKQPAHKAMLLLYEDRGEQFRVLTAYCNATTLERAGMLSLSLHDTVDTD